jgi:hypothetical protein
LVSDGVGSAWVVQFGSADGNIVGWRLEFDVGFALQPDLTGVMYIDREKRFLGGNPD